MQCRATLDGQVMVESSDKTWFTGEGNGIPLQHSCLENPMNSMKRQKDRTLKDELPRLVGTQYATGDQWRKHSRKNEEMEPKQKQHPVVGVTGDGSKVQCCKGFPHSSVGKESTCPCRRPRFDSWVRKIHWRRHRLPTPVFLGFPWLSW